MNELRGRLVLFAALAVTAAAIAAEEPFPVAAEPVLDDRYPLRQTAFPEGVVGLADIVFATPAGFRPLRLDLYRPKDVTTARPLVVYIHGGGWQSGHTRHAGAFENWPGVLAALAARGYVVASVEYRLSSEARFPAAIDDVRTAIRWLRSRAPEHGIDPKRVLVWGGSAGGQLAALSAMQCEPSECVQGLIAWYGIFDFALVGAGGADSAAARYLGCEPDRCGTATLAAASASAFVDATDPPVLLIHGVQDRVVPIQQSRDFLARLRARGVVAELLELPGVDHSFIGATPADTRTASRHAIGRSFDFIDRTLRKR
jgi:acetyl esterase/lipase